MALSTWITNNQHVFVFLLLRPSCCLFLDPATQDQSSCRQRQVRWESPEAHCRPNLCFSFLRESWRFREPSRDRNINCLMRAIEWSYAIRFWSNEATFMQPLLHVRRIDKSVLAQPNHRCLTNFNLSLQHVSPMRHEVTRLWPWTQACGNPWFTTIDILLWSRPFFLLLSLVTMGWTTTTWINQDPNNIHE